MARLKMTKTEQERAAEAAEATAEMTDEEKATEVQAVASKVASDVDKAKPEAKKKKDTRPKPVERKTPAQEAAKPTRPDSDPLQGATIDPDANYAKILNLQVSVGEDDTRSMEEFIEDVKSALTSQANAKIATVLLSKVSVDGKHILHFHYEREVARLRPEENDDE